MPSAVRVRFAPSPTGYLHIGGVRTAWFNWLYARGRDGRFILRIDDTDQQRNRREALAPILDGFRWLGLDWDEGPEVGGPHAPYFQSERGDLYQAAVDRLLERGYAYRDYATPEEIQAEREAATAAGRRFVYSRRFLAEDAAAATRYESAGRQATIRLRMPREGECRFEDGVRGAVAFAWADEQDHVVQRADGTVLYHLASVADDAAMEITDVIRAEEHLSNTPRQLWIFEGLGVEPPRFAHVPQVAEPGSRRKLSKRKLAAYLGHPDFAALCEHGLRVARRLGLEVEAESFNPVLVNFYAETGFEPHALLNTLLLLGWSLDDRSEDFSREEMIEHFDLERVGHAAASFDPARLMAFQERAMQALSIEERCHRVLPFLVKAGWVRAPEDAATREFVLRLVAAAGDRIKIAGDVLDYDEFFLADEELSWDETAFGKRVLAPGARELLVAYADSLETLAEDADASAHEAHMRTFLEERGLKLGALIHAVRVAVSGKAVGFGMFEILELLGTARCIRRIRRCLDHAAAQEEGA